MYSFKSLIDWRRSQLENLPHIQRLFNKSNSYELAKKAGVPTPKIYVNSKSNQLTLPADLPRAFVIKTKTGHSGKGVHCCLDGIDLKTGQPFDAEAFNNKIKLQPGYMIEEFIPNHKGSYHDIESFKVFYFGSQGSIIRYVKEYFDTTKGSITPIEQSFYTEDWEYFEEPISSYAKAGKAIARPPFLDQIRGYTKLLGEAVGDFTRIDFFASPSGVIFNEFSPFPFNGKLFTKYGDQFLGERWFREFALQYRPATIEDIDELAALLYEYEIETYSKILPKSNLRNFSLRGAYSNLKNLLEDNRFKIYICSDKITGKIVAMAGVGPLRFKQGVPSSINHEFFYEYTKPEYRRQGIYGKLTDLRKDFVRGRGHNSACALVVDGNNSMNAYFANKGNFLNSKTSSSPQWSGVKINIYGLRF